MRATWGLIRGEGQGLKKCPVCSSIAMDQDNTCGVCGSDLAAVPAIVESSLDQPVAQERSLPYRRLNKMALLVVLAGPVLSLLGLVLVLNLLNFGSELLALSGLALLILGLITTMGVIDPGPSFRGWVRYRARGRGFPDKYGSYDPRPREGEAEESQTSPEEQEEDYQTREERKKEGFD